MADGFYTNDDEDQGCFGGYGNDGAWAYAANVPAYDPSVEPRFGSAPEGGAFGAFEPPKRRQKRFAGLFGGGGSGGYERAA